MEQRKTIPRTTTTESLLGLLSMGPMSGYEIRQLIEESIGNFWRESYGQIYPALKRMVTDGLAEVKEQRTEGRPLKKVYSLTGRGQERLREWLDLPVTDQVSRNELLLKMFFGDRGDVAVLRQQVESKRRTLAADLARYWATEKRLQRYVGHSGLKFWMMTLRYGIAQTQALMEWCDECLKEL